MRKHLLQTLIAAIALVGLIVASALGEPPTVVRTGNLTLKLNGAVSPKKLPKHRLAPITLKASGAISTADGSQPPAAKTVKIDFDKHGAIDAKGLAVCRPGALQSRDTKAAKKACPSAIVGSGHTTVRVAFPEQQAFGAGGPLVLFNGGVRGGVTTMYIHAYVNVPAPTAIVTVVKIKKIHKGRYATRALARIPKVAGGSGSLTSFFFKIHRTFKYKGRKHSYLLARCANGRFFAHATTAFSDATRATGTIVRSCTPRG
jgi:hypothetical protein